MLFVSKVFLVFLIFSFAGWLLEVTYGLAETKKFVNRGFLIGPICPIYGVGCLAIVFLLGRYSYDAFILFLMSVIVCSIIEYMASYLLEKIFKTRWWDYTNMKFNINGRICLETLIPFGLLGLLVVYYAYPFVWNFLGYFSNITIYVAAGILAILFIVDAFTSLSIIINFKNTAVKVAKDSTEEVSKYVRAALSKNSIWTRRLIDSFPNLRIDFNELMKKFKRKKK